MKKKPGISSMMLIAVDTELSTAWNAFTSAINRLQESVDEQGMVLHATIYSPEFILEARGVKYDRKND